MSNIWCQKKLKIQSSQFYRNIFETRITFISLSKIDNDAAIVQIQLSTGSHLKTYLPQRSGHCSNTTFNWLSFQDIPQMQNLHTHKHTHKCYLFNILILLTYSSLAHLAVTQSAVVCWWADTWATRGSTAVWTAGRWRALLSGPGEWAITLQFPTVILGPLSARTASERNIKETIEQQ